MKFRSARKFIDSLKFFVKGGSGGNGLPKVGGIGGRGGHVCLQANENSTMKEVAHFMKTKKITAECGENSQIYRILGISGKDLIIDVPVGTSVTNEYGNFLAELNKPGNQVIVAYGGSGGTEATQFMGQKGQSQHIILNLKIIADVGLIGFPNAGKSTLLKALSRAKPRIASYPFTTIEPQVGNIVYNDLRNITIADLPGLIEGAHKNFGLGYNFLKHVERTRLLLFIVDIMGFQLKPTSVRRSAIETIYLLNKELELYKEELLDKPAILVLNKIDSLESKKLLEETLDNIKSCKGINEISQDVRPQKLIHFDEVISISSKFRTNTDYLKDRIRNWIDTYEPESVDFSKILQKIENQSKPIKPSLL